MSRTITRMIVCKLMHTDGQGCCGDVYRDNQAIGEGGKAIALLTFRLLDG